MYLSEQSMITLSLFFDQVKDKHVIKLTFRRFQLEMCTKRDVSTN